MTVCFSLASPHFRCKCNILPATGRSNAHIACKCMLYCILFSSQSKAPKEKMDKKGENAESAMFIISTVLSQRPKDSSLRLISINFVRFLSSPSLFFTKLLTVIVLQQRAWPPASTGPMWAAHWRPIPCRVCLSTRPTFSSVRRLTRRCCPKPAPKQCKTEPNRLRFIFASYRAPSANTPQPMIYPSRSQAAISAR